MSSGRTTVDAITGRSLLLSCDNCPSLTLTIKVPVRLTASCNRHSAQRQEANQMQDAATCRIRLLNIKQEDTKALRWCMEALQ